MTLAVIGMLIIGGLTAIGAALTTPGPKTARQSVGQNRAATIATSTAAQPSLSATEPQQTDNNPPSTVVSAPTDTPASQGTTLLGVIVSINSSAQTFVVRKGNGAQVTVAVDSSTAYSGFAGNFSGLTTGLSARLTGQTLPNGTFWAATIDTEN